MLRSKLIAATVAASTLVGVGGCALAEDGHHEMGGRQEVDAVLTAKTSLSEAIAAAEQRTGDTAVDSGLEWRDGVALYEITVASRDNARRVLVDPDTGKVLKVADISMRGDDRDSDGWFGDDED